MGTPYSTIIDRFLPTVSEYSFLELEEDEVYELVLPFLNAAATRFNDACIFDLNARDEENAMFVANLHDEEMDILADLMRVEWLKQKLYNSDLQRNGMSTKDYTVFSPANLQAQIRETYKDAREEAQGRLCNYTYTHSIGGYKTHLRDQWRWE